MSGCKVEIHLASRIPINRFGSRVDAGFSPPEDVRAHEPFGLIIRGQMYLIS